MILNGGRGSGPVSQDILATPDKQQIPPLRCAPVGMTECVNTLRDGM
jgi:hypothetical protein